MIKRRACLVALFVLAVAPALAQMAGDYTLGALKITQPWSRATPRGAPVAAGYLRITNAGIQADRLVSVATPVAGKPSIHEMSMDGGVMKMRALPNGIEIKPGQTVELKPGGYHLMFVGLKAPLKAGESFPMKLKFEKAGEVTVDVKVEVPGAIDSMKH